MNFSENDMALTLHFALFKGSDGYVLKPADMYSRILGDSQRSDRPGCEGFSGGGDERSSSTEPTDSTASIAFSARNQHTAEAKEVYWPPPRERIHRTTLCIISLHNLPKRCERRPSFQGSHGACHVYHTELSGRFVAPDGQPHSVPELVFALFQIGGFCGISNELPVPQKIEAEVALPAQNNGMNAAIGETLHCVASEPHATFLRVAIKDGGPEVAYESMVLGRLRDGFRVLQLRSMLGTRIELAFLFVEISHHSCANSWPTSRQVRQTAQKRVHEPARPALHAMRIHSHSRLHRASM